MCDRKWSAIRWTSNWRGQLLDQPVSTRLHKSTLTPSLEQKLSSSNYSLVGWQLERHHPEARVYPKLHHLHSLDSVSTVHGYQNFFNQGNSDHVVKIVEQ